MHFEFDVHVAHRRVRKLRGGLAARDTIVFRVRLSVLARTARRILRGT